MIIILEIKQIRVKRYNKRMRLYIEKALIIIKRYLLNINMNKLDPVCEKLGFSSLDDVEQLKELQKKTNIAPRHMAVIALVLLLVMMVLEYGASILCQVIGFVYPAYMSFKAIESKAEDDDK